MTRPRNKPAAVKKAAPPAAKPDTPPAALAPADPTNPLDLEVPDVAAAAAERDALLRDVYALNADQLEQLAYVTRVLEDNTAS